MPLFNLFVLDSLLPVLASSALDATNLFHPLAVGAEGQLSGAVALMGAASALASHQIPTGQQYPKRRIVFAFFQSQSFGKAGSACLARDIHHFQCQKMSGGVFFCFIVCFFVCLSFFLFVCVCVHVCVYACCDGMYVCCDGMNVVMVCML